MNSADFAGLNQFQRWYSNLPLVRRFTLPEPSRSAFYNLVIAFFVVTDGLGAVSYTHLTLPTIYPV